MRSLKQIKNRIRSIENTKKVTSAMEMISAAKLNRTDKILYALRPYFSHLDSLLGRLSASAPGLSNIYFEERPLKGKISLCLITSDSGLCGTYNDGILRASEELINKYGKDKISLVEIGRKGANHFKRLGFEVIHSYIGLNGRYSDKLAGELSENLIKIFREREADEVYVAYAHFENVMSHRPVIKKILNLEAPRLKKIEYILEPDMEGILEELVPKYIFTATKLFLLEAFTSEHASRTVAMKTATDNAKDLLQSLTLLRNKVRQANITQEIMEIVSSAEALKG